MTGDWILWLGWVGMAALFAGMIYVAWRALFHDRGRGKRRCPKCWHDLSHTPGMTCGECGFTADYEKEFHKTRRKLAVAVGAIVVCVMAAGFIHQRMDRRGWAAVAPTNVLIWTLPLSIDQNSFTGSELSRRMNMMEVSEGQWLSILERCAEGDWWREPVDDEWEDTYGQILNQWSRTHSRNVFASIATQGDSASLNRELLFRQQVRDLLLSIPPKVEARTRSDWPTGSAPRIDVTLREWWPREFESRLVLKTPGENDNKVIAYRGGRFAGDLPYSFQLPPAAAGELPASLDITVERRTSDDKWSAVWNQRVPITTFTAPQELAKMQPAQDKPLDDAVAATFNAGIVRWADGPSPVRFRVNVPATAIALFEGIAVGVKVELFRDDERARRLDLWWLGGVIDDRNYNFEIVHEDLELLNLLGSDTAQWTLRITGDEQIAQRAGPAPKFWNGSVEVPVVIVQQNGKSPPRPWWTQEQADNENADEDSTPDQAE